MNKDTGKSTFKQVFSVLSQHHKRFVEADRYVKKMTTLQLIELLMTAQLNREPSLRDISNSLTKEELGNELGLPSISAATVSRRQRVLDTIVLKTLFADLIAEFARKQGFNSLKNVLGNIYLIDSTTITLCLTKYRWAEFRSTKAGIKAHLRLKFGMDGNIPDKVVITPAKKSDITQMDELIVDETGALNLFDRGYNDYTKFDEYSEKGILFITRLKSNAAVEVVSDTPVDPQGAITKDRIVILGTGEDRMHHRLRLLETTDIKGNPVLILTNDLARSAQEIGDLYRYRWQIELFFKFIKQHLTVKHLYGQSPQATENQIYMALITYCLLLLLKMETGFTGTLLDLQRLLRTCLLKPFETFLRQLFREKRQSKGRKKVADYQIIFQETIRQVIAGKADYLDDPTFGPVIL